MAERKIKPLEFVFRSLIVLSLAAMVSIVFLNVVLRYIFNSGFPAGEEFARYLFVWICSLGTIAAYREGRHIGVDLLVSNLKGRPLSVVRALGRVVEIVVFALVLWGGVEYFATSASSPGPATGIPFGFVASSVIVLSASILVIIALDIVRKARSPRARPGEGD